MVMINIPFPHLYDHLMQTSKSKKRNLNRFCSLMSIAQLSFSLKSQLQKIIEFSNQNLEDVTPRKLMIGNLIKGVFGNHTLTEIHASLNDADKLRTLIHRKNENEIRDLFTKNIIF
ncbi:hypothetical protein GLOIN_2v1791412 [Rhizophagus clarus]|uniref:Uncharacterized protein n=1 Tax=Rhizophagus clarus TaxID=94130 RepID=A0A8H3R1N9_9GLOM|nr:hypothetical protein GLOIN_2v1791412 [Rhizophagus clarus]